MASLGNSIKHSFEKKTISSTALGVLMSTFTTVAPMFFIIGGILFLYLDFRLQLGDLFTKSPFFVQYIIYFHFFSFMYRTF